MSKVGIVTDRGTSAKGKPTIHIDNQLYYAGRTDLAGLTVGDKISFDSTAFGDRGDLWSINPGWKLLEGASKYPPSIQPVNVVFPPAAPARPNAPPERAPNEAELRFISNCVGSAISAGTIKEPEQIEKWTSAARNALREQME
jgi:hypothetical protein